MGRSTRRPKPETPQDILDGTVTFSVDPDAELGNAVEPLAELLISLHKDKREQQSNRAAAESSKDDAAMPSTGENTMNQVAVRRLEEEIEKAIAQVFRRLAKGRSFKSPSNDRTYHLMAKAAVAVYEAVDEERQAGTK